MIMEETLLGIPFFTWGRVCLGLAVLWYFIWPKDKTPESLKQSPTYKPRPVWVHSVLRWFHALAWVLLAATCCCWMPDKSRWPLRQH
jgi:hypothetical protein